MDRLYRNTGTLAAVGAIRQPDLLPNLQKARLKLKFSLIPKANQS
jgi:hypothetical protein